MGSSGHQKHAAVSDNALHILYDFPQLRSESVDQLRSYRDEVSMSSDTLNNIERRVDTWDDMLVSFAAKRLDSALHKTSVLNYVIVRVCLKFSDLDSFLQFRIRAS